MARQEPARLQSAPASGWLGSVDSIWRPAVRRSTELSELRLQFGSLGLRNAG
jgi:hypothetical protein